MNETGPWLNSQGSIPAAEDFNLLHSVQTESGTNLASYPMCAGSIFPEV
jgi:hypothetical protein